MSQNLDHLTFFKRLDNFKNNGIIARARHIFHEIVLKFLCLYSE